MRRMLFGAAVACLVGGAAAANPVKPLPEAREVDPVAREFHHGRPPVPPAEDGDRPPSAARGMSCPCPVLAICAVLASIPQTVTLPVGPIPAAEV